LLFLDVRRDANLSQFCPIRGEPFPVEARVRAWEPADAVAGRTSRPGRTGRRPSAFALQDARGVGQQRSFANEELDRLVDAVAQSQWCQSPLCAKASRSRFRPYSVSGTPSTTSPALRPSKRARRRSLGLGSPERGIGERRARKPTWLRAIRLGSAQIGAVTNEIVPARRRGRMPERPALIFGSRADQNRGWPSRRGSSAVAGRTIGHLGPRPIRCLLGRKRLRGADR
jgi:hypothetical protein